MVEILMNCDAWRIPSGKPHQRELLAVFRPQKTNLTLVLVYTVIIIGCQLVTLA